MARGMFHQIRLLSQFSINAFNAIECRKVKYFYCSLHLTHQTHTRAIQYNWYHRDSQSDRESDSSKLPSSQSISSSSS